MAQNKAFDHSKYDNWIDPKDVIPYARNAKNHTEKQVKNIANSIRRFGWQQDTVITSDNVLVIGHGRRLAALQIGCEMPYHMIDKTADELTDDDIRELRLVDNKLNESPWDETLRALEQLDLTFEGFDFEEEVKEITKSEERAQRLKEMELKEFEHYDYIVCVFKNQFDWLHAVDLFGLERVDAGYDGTHKIGLGRVIDGAKLFEIIGHKGGNPVKGSVESAENNEAATGMGGDSSTDI